jgi:GntR family transcriptional regulator
LINKEQPIPLYYQVKEDLLEKINQNIFQVGGLIPSESELQNIYKVSRITIRRAIQELVQEGYLSTQQGKGTFVSQPKATQELNVITSWAETMAKLGMHPETRNIKYSEEPALVAIAKLLNIEPGKMIYKIERLRYAAGKPICIMTNYLIPETAPDFLEKGIEGESLYETLEKRYNLHLNRAVETVEARAAKLGEAELLKIKRGSPLLQVTRVTYDIDERPIEVVIGVSRADRYSYTVNLIGRPKK